MATLDTRNSYSDTVAAQLMKSIYDILLVQSDSDMIPYMQMGILQWQTPTAAAPPVLTPRCMLPSPSQDFLSCSTADTRTNLLIGLAYPAGRFLSCRLNFLSCGFLAV